MTYGYIINKNLFSVAADAQSNDKTREFYNSRADGCKQGTWANSK